jgi:hypothetical protein
MVSHLLTVYLLLKNKGFGAISTDKLVDAFFVLDRFHGSKLCSNVAISRSNYASFGRDLGLLLMFILLKTLVYKFVNNCLLVT